MSTPWIYLIIAGLLEVCWAIGLKYTDGFTKPAPSLFTAAAFLGSMFLLAKAAQELPIGTAYAIWVGIGAFGAAVLGMVLFQESASTARLLCLGLLLTSIISLKLAH